MFNHAEYQPSELKGDQKKTTAPSGEPKDQFNHHDYAPRCGKGPMVEANNRNPDPQFNDSDGGVNPRG